MFNFSRIFNSYSEGVKIEIAACLLCYSDTHICFKNLREVELRCTCLQFQRETKLAFKKSIFNEIMRLHLEITYLIRIFTRFFLIHAKKYTICDGGLFLQRVSEIALYIILMNKNKLYLIVLSFQYDTL